MSISAPFPYRIDPDVKRSNPTSVFKLMFGVSKKKYFIYKGLRLVQLVESLSAQIHRERSNIKEKSILYKVVTYINQSRVAEMSVEVIKETDNPVELLISEYEALQEAKNDTDCLNTSFINNASYPAWIPQKAVNEFNKWLQGEKIPDRHRNLRRYLNSALNGMKKKKSDTVDKIIKYVTEHYK